MYKREKILVWLYFFQFSVLLFFYLFYKNLFIQSTTVFLVLFISLVSLFFGAFWGKIFFKKVKVDLSSGGLVTFSKQFFYLVFVLYFISVAVRLIYLYQFLSYHSYSELRGYLFEGEFSYPSSLILIGRFGVLICFIAFAYKLPFIYRISVILLIFLSDVTVAGRGDLFTAIQIILLIYLFNNKLRFKTVLRLTFSLIFVLVFLFLMHYYRSGGGAAVIFIELLISNYLVGPLVGIVYSNYLDGSFGALRLIGLPMTSLGLDYYRPDFDFGSGYTNAYNGLAIIYRSGGYFAVFFVFFVYGFFSKIHMHGSSYRSLLLFVILGMFTLNLFRGYSLDWAFYWLLILYFFFMNLMRSSR